MPVYTVDSSSFEDVINNNELALIDFWAEWCAPCKAFSKIYEKVSDKFPQYGFTKINIEEEPGLAEIFHVRSIPHLVILKEGVAIYSESGTVPESTLLELIHQAIATDVSDIKKKLESGEE